MNAKRVFVLSAVLLLAAVVKGLALPTPDDQPPNALPTRKSLPKSAITAKPRKISNTFQITSARALPVPRNSKRPTIGPPKHLRNTASPTSTSNPGKSRTPGRAARQKPASSRPPSIL